MIQILRRSVTLRSVASPGLCIRSCFVLPILMLACLTPGVFAEKPTADQLDAALQRATSGDYWGVALVVREGETILSKGYGAADYRSRKNTPDTLFEIASITKQFTAAAILHLVHEDRLELTTTLGELFPRQASKYKDVTVEQLLSHTSGMNPSGGVPYNSTIKRDAYIKRVLAVPPSSPPGQTFAYSNVGYALLAAIIETVTGESFEDYAHEHLFRPAGLVDTGFIKERDLDRTRVATRISTGSSRHTSADWHYGWGYRGMGGVVTTANDLYRWSNALRTDAVLPEELREELFRARTNNYALGWQVNSGAGDKRLAQHSGGVQGFASFFMHDIDKENVVVLLSNGKSDFRSILEEFSKISTQTDEPEDNTEDINEDQEKQADQNSLKVDVRTREMSDLGRVQLGTDLRWRVMRSGERVALNLSDENDTPVQIELSDSYAKVFMRSLQQVVDARDDDGQEFAQTETDVYLYAYGKEPEIEPKDIVVAANSHYRGQRDGVRYVDNRVTLTVVDKERRFWPIISKLNSKAAEQLAAELRAVIEAE